jgi:hypothetical protein
VLVTPGEALSQVLFWGGLYDQKGTQADFMMDEIIEANDKARITRSTTKQHQDKAFGNVRGTGEGTGARTGWQVS